MQDQLKERCIYCGADVFYTGAELLIKCGMCGHTLAVAKFENELARMNAAIEEGEAAKRALKEAEKEKQAANDRLHDTLTSLSDLQNGQEQNLSLLKQIRDDQTSDLKMQEDLTQLVQAMNARLVDDQDTLSGLFQLLLSSQKEDAEKLILLQSLSRKILAGQEDVLIRLNTQAEVITLLQSMAMDAEKRQVMTNEFLEWSQAVQAEDAARLKDIEASAGSLLSGQKAVLEKIDRLQISADQIQENLAGFEEHWQKAQLEELQNLCRQAENFRQDRNFEKAADYYHRIITKGGADAEVYWRLLLCHYCVSYQQDDRGQMIPILLNPDLTDPSQMSLRQAFAEELKKTGKASQTIYREELGRIDRILDKYRQVRHNVDYDVFISVRQRSGRHYTADSDIASDLYDYLVSRGLKVFNSRRTRIPAGQEFEPYIIASLMSARAMIVVGTSAENMTSEWVRNEWTRYQWLQINEQKKYGRSDRLLLCYLAGDMDYSEIPRALNPNRQAIRAGVGADDQLIRALGSLMKDKDDGHVREPADPVPRPQGAAPSVDAPPEEDKVTPRQVINQMTALLFKKQYADVLKKYEELSSSGKYLEYARIHLCVLCAEKQVEDIDHLVRSDLVLSEHPTFKLAMRLCTDPEEQSYLKKLQKENQAWNNPDKQGPDKKLAAGIAAAVLFVVIAAVFALNRKPSSPPVTAGAETQAQTAELPETYLPETAAPETEAPETAAPETSVPAETYLQEPEPVMILREMGFKEKEFDLHFVPGSWAGYEGRSHTTAVETRCSTEEVFPLNNGSSYVLTIMDSSKLKKKYDFGFLVFEGSPETLAMIDAGWESFTDISAEQIESHYFTTDITGSYMLAFNIRKKDDSAFTENEIAEVEKELGKQLIIWENAN